MRPSGWLRWWVMGAFVISSALNYLDRQILAALAPLLQSEFHMSDWDYGMILFAFSIPYALSAPFVGRFIDRVGLNRGISVAVGLWSLAGGATAFVRGFWGLAGCRAALGVGEAGGVPAAGKAIAIYLRPEERALGNALGQIGLGLGGFIAPPLAIWLAAQYSWRAAFMLTGLAGLLWIPFWNRVSRLVPASPDEARPAKWPVGEMLRDRRLWSFTAANALSMTVYTLWTNWTTKYLVGVHQLALEETKWLAALPPLAFNLGGLAGGTLSMAWMKRGLEGVPARMRVCLLSAVALLATAAIPLTPTAALATAGICLSAFWSSAWSVNLYSMPLDVYSGRRAAFAISMLVFAYGAMQAVFSPLIGAITGRFGFAPVCVLVSAMPLAAWVLLRAVNR